MVCLCRRSLISSFHGILFIWMCLQKLTSFSPSTILKPKTTFHESITSAFFSKSVTSTFRGQTTKLYRGNWSSVVGIKTSLMNNDVERKSKRNKREKIRIDSNLKPLKKKKKGRLHVPLKIPFPVFIPSLPKRYDESAVSVVGTSKFRFKLSNQFFITKRNN